MRATLEDIAIEAGVSPMTVSNVLRNQHRKTSERTRRIVLAAASKLQYVPVQTGRQNSHVKMSTIGLIERRFMEVQHPIRTMTFDGIQTEAAERGYDITMLLRPQPTWILDANEATFLDRRVNGFVIRNAMDIQYMVAAISSAKMPCVTCFTDSPPPGIGSVTLDNEWAIRDAIEFLAAHGHRRIGHITGGIHPDGIARETAYNQCVAELGLDIDKRLVVQGKWGDRDEIVGINAILASGASAVVCGSDYQALQLWDAAISAGVSVPGDLSIIGIDDIEESRYRGLTTLASPFHEIGRVAVRILIDMIEKRHGEPIIRKVRGRVIERQSVARFC